ncbi:MAG: SUMF1/EgtB/PvdO family nonheme iron enzyme [Verrucomicrobiaceae bacterium]|nr:SUMF1/EgtB/PvdO family nonheme iron enzyme [Verrucomicrobiaceae bacterium]
MNKPAILRKALADFLTNNDVSRRELAQEAGIDNSQLGRFLKTGAGLSDDRLERLDQALHKHLGLKRSKGIIAPAAMHDLAQALREERLTLFVGAGLSRQAKPLRGTRQLPLWSELAQRLTREILGESVADERKTLPPLDQLDCIQAEGCKDQVIRLLRDDLLNDRDYAPSPAHLVLAKLPWKAVITTNYDGLLSHRDVMNVRYPVVTERDFLTHDPRSIRLVHLNGDLREPHTLFSSDYHGWEQAHPRAFAFLRSAVSPPNRALFVGYSFSDPFLQELLATVRQMSTREGFQNVVHAWMWKLNEADKLLLKHRYHVEAQSIDADSGWERAFTELGDAYQKLSGRALGSAPPVASADLRQKYADQQRQTYERATLGGLYVGEAYRAEDVLLENIFVEPSLCLSEEEQRERAKDKDLLVRKGRGTAGGDATLEGWTEPYDCRLAYEWMEHEKLPCLVILGEPGSGKSSLLQRFMLDHLKAWVKDPADTFPIYLRLSLWEKERVHGASLLDYALVVMSRDLGLTDETQSQLLRPWLTSGPVHWLLDGIDEVRDPSARAALRDELERLRMEHPAHRWTVSTRPSGYREEHHLRAPWQHVELAPLDQEQSLTVLQKWSVLLQRLHKLPQPYFNPEEVFGDLGSQPGLSRLRHNPLLLTMIILFFRDLFRLPHNRWEFYTHATQSLRLRWVRHRSTAAAFGSAERRAVERPFYDTLLPQVAIEAMRTGRPVMSRSELGDILRRVLQLDGWSAREIVEEADFFFNVAIALIGVIVEKGLERFGFVHLTFEEYYAACWLHQNPKECAELIRTHARHPDWQEVWELYALGLGNNKEKLDELHALAGSDDEAMSLRVHWLGLGNASLPQPDDSGARQKTQQWALAQLQAPATHAPVLKALADWEREYPQELRTALLGKLDSEDNEQAHTAAAALGEQCEGRELRKELLGLLCKEPKTPKDSARTRGFAEFALSQKADAPAVQRALLSLYQGAAPEGFVGTPSPEARAAAARALGGRVASVSVWDHSGIDTRVVQLAPEVAITFVRIPAGTLPALDERTHPVTLSEFWLAQTQLTQAQWLAVMGGENPSRFKGDHLPVEKVSWDDITGRFNAKLAALDAFALVFPGHQATLPTEAQWEYACRAGTTTPFNNGTDALISAQANFDGNHPAGKDAKPGVHRQRTVVAGSFEPNKFGLHDMHGNVWEWCSDWYGDYPANATTDYAGPGTGAGRVVRGGSWFGHAGRCSSGVRFRFAPGGGGGDLGFRPAVTIRGNPASRAGGKR